MLRLLYFAFLYWRYEGNLCELLTLRGRSEDSSISGGNIDVENNTNSPSAPVDGSHGQERSGGTRHYAGAGQYTEGIKFDTGNNDLKRSVIVERYTALTVLTSIASDLDLFADWYFFKEALGEQTQLIYILALIFSAIGTIMYFLLAVEFHPISKVWACWRTVERLGPDEHVPLGLQLAINVVVEDIPQLAITIVVIANDKLSAASVLNVATASFALLAKAAEAFATRHDLPMSSELRLIETDKGVVRYLVDQRRNADRLKENAVRLALACNRYRQEEISEQEFGRNKRLTAMAFEVFRIDPSFVLSGGRSDIREKLGGSRLDLYGAQLEETTCISLGKERSEVERSGTATESLSLKSDGWTTRGPIPAALGDLRDLQEFTLSSNKFDGSIPSQLGNLSALTRLDIRGNNLTGSIPEALGNLRALTELYLNANKLTGPIPATLGKLVLLKEVRLDDNELEENIPQALGNLTALETLCLEKNKLTGDIPPQLGDLTNLSTLTLGHNELTGSIPWQLGNLTRLYTLRFQKNRLKGPIPSQLAGLTGVKQIYFTGNLFSAEEVAQLKRLIPSCRTWDDGDYGGLRLVS